MNRQKLPRWRRHRARMRRRQAGVQLARSTFEHTVRHGGGPITAEDLKFNRDYRMITRFRTTRMYLTL